MADYRDTDSNNDGTLDGVSASLTAQQASDLAAGTATYANQFILLTGAVDLDLTGNTDVAGTFTNDIEYLDMADGAAQTFTVEAQDVIDMTGAANKLIILGDAGDTVDLRGTNAFANTGKDQSIQGSKFSIYEADVGGTIVQVFIEDEIGTVTLT